MELPRSPKDSWTQYSTIKIAGPAKFKIGDSVCVSKYKPIFEKGYTPNWITEVFTIVKVQHINFITYLLENYREKSVAGAFYEHELYRAIHLVVYLMEKVLCRKEDKVYIKWLGFDGLHNSKTMLFDKILIHVFHFYIQKIYQYKYIKRVKYFFLLSFPSSF